MDGYRVFTWDTERFPDPPAMLERLSEQGFRVITIIDPGVKWDPGYPVFDQDERDEIISSLKMVDEVFVEESLEKKRDYIVEHGASVLVMGDDWTGKFDWVSDVCEVVYLPRTPSVSTTGLIEHIAKIAP
ncbi:glycerol-3-phosphate cytidylyltransferase [Salmonella enterica subsp. enterica serovar Javiana]|nr:glycerol-3-phosphate cytidylyltransferase [Salmonella enterica subsp. enterica serovar Javiana]